MIEPYESITIRRGTTARVVCSVVREEPIDYRVDTATNALRYRHDRIVNDPTIEPEKENVIVILNDTRGLPIAWSLVSVGTLDEALVHPREVLRPAIMCGAKSFVLLHNHPSGDPMPSRTDDLLTRRIGEAATLMGIRLSDHVVVGGRGKYYSYQESGMIA